MSMNIIHCITHSGWKGGSIFDVPANGIPVVAIKAGKNSEIIGISEVAFLVGKKNPPAPADGIITLTSDPSLTAGMMAEKTVRLYQKLLPVIR